MQEANWLQIKLNDFLQEGLSHLGPIFDSTVIGHIFKKINESRDFAGDLFLSSVDFEANPEFTGVNPKRGRNFTEKISQELEALEQTPRLAEFLSGLLGSKYRVLDRKIVCGVPEAILPKWILDRVAGKAVNNLGCYVKPEYRDITYFLGIDFHQDLIDWPDQDPNFVTLYVYLEDVDKEDGPLVLLPKTHFFGASQFPHDLKLETSEKRTWSYSSLGFSSLFEEETFVGTSGSAAVWHACLLHGTAPVTSFKPRLSLRYLIAKQDHEEPSLNLLEKLNATLQGPSKLHATRVDQSDDGEVISGKNKLFEHRDQQ